MNPFGSYRALRDNAISALMASIEIYNKPRMAYRNECFVILLVNAWELALKAVLSKNRRRLYYHKKRGEPYRSLTLFDALKEAKAFFPPLIPFKPVAENIARLADFRNNSMHFYNEEGFGVLIYGLAQTSIINFRDLMREVFELDVADEVNLSLLPLSFSSPPDPVQFLRSKTSLKSKTVAEYIGLISTTTKELEEEGVDTGRFLTVFTVSLQSTKRIESADIIVSVGAPGDKGTNIVTRPLDPNKSHPWLRKRVLTEIGTSLHGIRFNSHTFEAIAWAEKLKGNPRYYWKPDEGGTSHYSPDIVGFIKGLTRARIEAILALYRRREEQIAAST